MRYSAMVRRYSTGADTYIALPFDQPISHTSDIKPRTVDEYCRTYGFTELYSYIVELCGRLYSAPGADAVEM